MAQKSGVGLVPTPGFCVKPEHRNPLKGDSGFRRKLSCPTVIMEKPTVIMEKPTVIMEKPTVIIEKPTVIEERA